jgi:hypothetical protein
MAEQLTLLGTLTPPRAAQLTLSGTWEPIYPESRAPEPDPTPPPQPPVDPRQAALFEGPQALRRAAEAACERLDPTTLRTVCEQARQEHPAWPGSKQWPTWADSIDHLLGEAPAGAQEAAARALALAGRAATRRFPELSAARRGRLRAEALRRAAARLFAEEGSGARLPDGRPAGYLHLLGGVPEEAVVSLQLQAQAWTGAGRGRVLGYLGEALWRCGRAEEATRVYLQAYHEDPTCIDEQELTCRPFLEKLGAGAAIALPSSQAPARGRRSSGALPSGRGTTARERS